MSQRKIFNGRISGLAASVAAGTILPQFSDAAIVTVGGDGGTGSVTLDDSGDSTDFDGLLAVDISYVVTANDAVLRQSNTAGGERLFYAFRSAIEVNSVSGNTSFNFMAYGGEADNALFNSNDNWVPGLFSVNGVNDEDPIFGWLQVQLGGAFDSFDPTIISFTYDDTATDDTAFAKPEGGFSVSSDSIVPEPGSLALASLALGAAGVAALRRRRRKGEANVESSDA